MDAAPRRFFRQRAQGRCEYCRLPQAAQPSITFHLNARTLVQQMKESAMYIELSTDSNIKGSAELTQQVGDAVQAALDRFRERITVVGVFLADENSSAKPGGDDVRCTMEARLAGLQPITVSHRGATVEQAVDGAAATLEKTLKRTLGRLDDPTGRTSFGGDQTI